MIQRKHIISFLVVALLLTGLLMISCTDKSAGPVPDDGKNVELKTRVANPAALTSANLVRLTVFGPDIDTIVEETPLIGGAYFELAVEVPVGLDRTFILELINNQLEPPQVLYRGVTRSAVAPEIAVLVEIDLDPVVPIFRLSPAWQDHESGTTFDVVFEVANLPVLGGAAILFNIDYMLMDAVEIELGPGLNSNNVALVGQAVNDGLQYSVYIADTTGAQLVPAGQTRQLATISFATEVVAGAEAGGIRELNIVDYQALDPEGNAYSPGGEFVDGATVNVVPVADRPVSFADSTLAEYIRSYYSLGTAPLMLSDVIGVTWIEVQERGVTNVSGVENLANLRSLYLDYNSISDVSFLTPLRRLRVFSARYCGLTSIDVVSNWPELFELDIGSNRTIADLSPVATRTELRVLGISDLGLANLALAANMSELLSLNAASNSLTDISTLASKSDLVTLVLAYNDIVDISVLEQLTSLRRLELQGNQITNLLPLINNAGIGSGDTIDVGGNPLDSISETDYINDLRLRGAVVYYYGIGK